MQKNYLRNESYEQILQNWDIKELLNFLTFITNLNYFYVSIKFLHILCLYQSEKSYLFYKKKMQSLK